MQAIILKDKSTGEVMGVIVSKQNTHDFTNFITSVEIAWRVFNRINDSDESESNGDFLEDFCDFHNDTINSGIKIETALFEIL